MGQNNGKLAFQHIFHVHFHVVPKPNEKEGLVLDVAQNWPMKKAENEALAATCKKMKGPTEPQPVLPWPDISSRAKWSVSSFKFGFGAECLRDDDPDTFWHSDGPQPHFITAEFPRKVAIQKISIHLSFPQDDSYTPSALAIRAGTGPSDLQDVRVVTLDKPEGWITFDVTSEPNEEGDGLAPVYAYVLQVIIAQNHMSGKDTHVRGLKILGPVEHVSFSASSEPF
ncbi:hypothetical protein H0H87_002923 [Tephrocybe sp. NHM501043]|nr:hypothetical protein H0H87_002923 [Tephrocybe sp. NHM501043]